MSTSVSYDLLNALERRRWGMIYLVVGGAHAPDATQLKAMVAEQLPEFDLSYPISITSMAASDAPFEVLDAEGITALKWPVKLKTGTFSDDLEGTIQQRLRSTVNRALITDGYEVIQLDVEPVGEELTGDQDIPPTPRSPSAVVHLWPAAVVGALALLSYKALTKKR